MLESEGRTSVKDHPESNAFLNRISTIKLDQARNEVHDSNHGRAAEAEQAKQAET